MHWMLKSKTIAGVAVSLLSAFNLLAHGKGMECTAQLEMIQQLDGFITMAGLLFGPMLSAYGRIDRERRD